MKEYSIQNVIDFRNLEWSHSKDILMLTNIPSEFEKFTMTPDYFCCGIIREGEIVLELDEEIVNVNRKSRTLFFYRPKQNLNVISISPGTKGFVVLFNKKFIKSLEEPYISITDKTFLENRFGTFYRLTEKHYEHLQQLFSKIFDLLSFTSPELWNHTAKSLMLILINETDYLLMEYKIQDNSLILRKSEKVVERFVQLVSENYLNSQHLEFYAQKLNISTNYLHKIIQSTLDTTPYTIIQNTILAHAKILLENKDSTISEIAELLSFNDVYSFSKFFKKKMHTSPVKYRKNLSS